MSNSFPYSNPHISGTPQLVILSFLFILICPLFLYGQKDTIIDSRDNEMYETVLIGNKLWFKDFLRHKTKRSKFRKRRNMPIEIGYRTKRSTKRKFKSVKVGYYSNLDLDSVCPEGWHVATIDEWEELVQNVVDSKNLTLDTVIRTNNDTTILFDQITLFYDTPYGFFRTGWIEGIRLASRLSMSIWVTNPYTKDNKFHVHLSSRHYSAHTHEHHIIDKRRKIRKFAVRCVCDQTYNDHADVDKQLGDQNTGIEMDGD